MSPNTNDSTISKRIYFIFLRRCFSIDKSDWQRWWKRVFVWSGAAEQKSNWMKRENLIMFASTTNAIAKTRHRNALERFTADVDDVVVVTSECRMNKKSIRNHIVVSWDFVTVDWHFSCALVLHRHVSINHNCMSKNVMQRLQAKVNLRITRKRERSVLVKWLDFDSKWDGQQHSFDFFFISAFHCRIWDETKLSMRCCCCCHIVFDSWHKIWLTQSMQFDERNRCTLLQWNEQQRWSKRKKNQRR